MPLESHKHATTQGQVDNEYLVVVPQHQVKEVQKLKQENVQIDRYGRAAPPKK